MLEIGTKAPDFELPAQNGEVHKLSDYLGKILYLIFDYLHKYYTFKHFEA